MILMLWLWNWVSWFFDKGLSLDLVIMMEFLFVCFSLVMIINKVDLLDLDGLINLIEVFLLMFRLMFLRICICLVFLFRVKWILFKVIVGVFVMVGFL